jgi:hypothetical protein
MTSFFFALALNLLLILLQLFSSSVLIAADPNRYLPLLLSAGADVPVFNRRSLNAICSE